MGQSPAEATLARHHIAGSGHFRHGQRANPNADRTGQCDVARNRGTSGQGSGEAGVDGGPGSCPNGDPLDPADYPAAACRPARPGVRAGPSSTAGWCSRSAAARRRRPTPAGRSRNPGPRRSPGSAVPRAGPPSRPPRPRSSSRWPGRAPPPPRRWPTSPGRGRCRARSSGRSSRRRSGSGPGSPSDECPVPKSSMARRTPSVCSRVRIAGGEVDVVHGQALGDLEAQLRRLDPGCRQSPR